MAPWSDWPHIPVAAGVSSGRRVQYAALPYRVRRDGEVQIRLITSRETRRWVIPKGWPIKGLTPPKTAARESYEEAGLVGVVSREPLGAYTYEKRLGTRSVLCDVLVFPLKVKRLLQKWPERFQRYGFWFSIETAAAAVQEEDLSQLILSFGDIMARRWQEKLADAAAVAEPAVLKAKAPKSKAIEAEQVKGSEAGAKAGKARAGKAKVAKADEKPAKAKAGKAKTEKGKSAKVGARSVTDQESLAASLNSSSSRGHLEHGAEADDAGTVVARAKMAKNKEAKARAAKAKVLASRALMPDDGDAIPTTGEAKPPKVLKAAKITKPAKVLKPKAAKAKSAQKPVGSADGPGVATKAPATKSAGFVATAKTARVSDAAAPKPKRKGKDADVS